MRAKSLLKKKVNNSLENLYIDKAKLGDSKAYEKLVELYKDRLFFIVFKYIHNEEQAFDIVQKSFLDAWQSIDKFEHRSTFLTWLIKIAINNSKKELIKNKNFSTVDIDRPEIVDSNIEVLTYKPELDLELDRRSLLIHELNKLTKRQRLIVHLRIFEGLSFKEIAKILKSNPNTIKAHFHYIKNHLKKVLKND